MTIRIAIVGFGKIARDQHLPTIKADNRYELVGVSTRSGDPGLGLPCYGEPAEMFKQLQGRLDAVAICTPPTVRHDIAKAALEAGLAVMLEKPPAATLGEIEDLERLAQASGNALFATWHSQHAPGVAGAASVLAGKTITKLDISWVEDVRKWHPGQEWIWAPGGFGVFDPGINALSIATHILPMPLFVREAVLTYPSNKQAPIAAALAFAGDDMKAVMDWRSEEGEQWSMRVGTAEGTAVELLDGGHRLLIDGAEQPVEQRGEYPGLYDRFADVVQARQVDVDREPLRIVADAFLIGQRDLTDPFE